MERAARRPRARVARLREVAETGETVRFVPSTAPTAAAISYDHVPLGDDGSAGRLWTFRDITQFKLAGGGAAQFLATMSHEIKTPLSGIAGAAELLLQRRSADRERELARGDRRRRPGARRTVRDALDVTRAEAGRAEHEAGDYDPRRLLTSIAGVLRPSLRGRPLELLVEVDADVPDALRGDPARVRQIVLNLASNAVKYTESGHARIGARVDGERVLITVSDTGRGIGEEDLQRLFEPWTRNAHARLGRDRPRASASPAVWPARWAATSPSSSELGTGSAFTLELPLEAGELRAGRARQGRARRSPRAASSWPRTTPRCAA